MYRCINYALSFLIIIDCYRLCVVFLSFVVLLQVGFLLAFYFIYNGFEVPILIRCSEDPCPNTVDCYIAKATEKKIFLYIMGCTSILCIALNVVEFVYILWKRIWKCFTRRYITVEERNWKQSQPPATLVNNSSVCTQPTANTIHTTTESRPQAPNSDQNLPSQSRSAAEES